MRTNHLFIPDKNVTEVDYISLVDIILGIENVDGIELQHLKDECARKMKYFQEHIISDEEYRQLKHIHFKNTYSPQDLWEPVFSEISLQEYQVIPFANSQELDINFYKKYLYDIFNNKYSSLDKDVIDKYNQYFYTKAYDSSLELELKNRKSNKYDYFYISTIAKDGMIRCGVKGIVLNSKTKKAVYIFTEQLSSRDMYILGEPNTIYLTPTTNLHSYSSWNVNLFIKNAIHIKEMNKNKRLLLTIQKIQEILE